MLMRPLLNCTGPPSPPLQEEGIENRQLVEIEIRLVCVGAIGVVNMARGPATGRDLQSGAYEIADRLAPATAAMPCS